MKLGKVGVSSNFNQVTTCFIAGTLIGQRSLAAILFTTVDTKNTEVG